MKFDYMVYIVLIPIGIMLLISTILLTYILYVIKYKKKPASIAATNQNIVSTFVLRLVQHILLS